MYLEQLIKGKRGTLIDVRSRTEYNDGHVTWSINIPLNEIPDNFDELKLLPLPIILCCTSGNRSGQAVKFLSNHGIECVNAGSWMDVMYIELLTL
ncbi:MAG: rhodanese-like domain-containing protein [Bacteroidota bacterium]